MAKTIEDLFFYLVFVFDFLIVIQVLLSIKNQKQNKILWLLLGYCILNSSCNLLQTIPPAPRVEYLMLGIFTLIEFLLFSFLFKLIIKNKKFYRVILSLSIIFFLVAIKNYDTNKAQRIDAVPIGVETIFILVFSFYYLYEQMNIVDDSFIYSRYHFWLVIGIMVYLSGSFFIYIFTNQAQSVIDNFWFLTYVFYIIKNIFFAIGISYYSKKAKHPPLKQYRPYLN